MKLQIKLLLIALSITCSMRCDFVSALDPLGTTTFNDSNIYTINWCGCNYLAAGGFWQDDGQPGSIGIFQFDQTTETLSLIATTTFFFDTYSLRWCPSSSCQFLAAGGDNIDGEGQIQIYTFYHTGTPTLEPIVNTTTTLGSNVWTLDWCPLCSFLAAGGINETHNKGIIQIYVFDGANLTDVGSSFTIDQTSEIRSIKWCNDCHNLVATGSTYLAILGFDPAHPENGLTQLYSQPAGNHIYQTVDLCNDCGYLAVGGNDGSTHGIIDIYQFDPNSTPSLTLVDTASIEGLGRASFGSLKWCQGCTNLAAVGYTVDDQDIETAILNLYHLDIATGKLSSPQTHTLSFSVNFLPADLVDWCGKCCYLAAAGDNAEGVSNIQLFKGNACLSAPSNLRAQKIFHRFPTQLDIIDQLCWDSATGAIAYKIYADAALTILLATIPSPTLCFSQHQICRGKTLTYYVTAVDANGNQSEPAVITI